ncbi:MAG TPA: thiamine pyrophosphate-dependent enzyme, partial [Candidatus Lokiarchaeia archaeon]
SCSINGCRTIPAMSEIESAVDLIRNAKQPVIYTGNGAIVSGAFAEVAHLSQMLKAPVFSTISGKGIMLFNPNLESNLYFGTIGLFGEKPNHRFIRSKTDLLIVVGNRLTEDDTANFKVPGQNLEMIQIDIDPAEIGLSYNPLGVIGDPKEALKEIIDILLENRNNQSNNNDEILKERIKNLEALKKWHDEYRNSDNAKWMFSNPIKPQRVLKAISDNFTENDYLITDASSSSRWIGAYFPIKSIGRKIITPRGVGPTGFGVGALIGTCIADNLIFTKNNKSKKILFSGDGGLMNGGITEFETIKKLNLNCSIVVINNYSLGFVKFGQALLFKHKYYETDRPNTNFAKIVESFGGYGLQVENLNQLDSAIKDALNYDGFSLVDVIIDPMELLPPNFY